MKTATSLLKQLKKFKKRPPTPTKEFEVAQLAAGRLSKATVSTHPALKRGK